MSKLVENILTNNMIESNKLFEERMNNILERKLVEIKKQMQAESFGMLKFTKAEIEAKKKAGYRKASEVLGDPAKMQLSTATKKYRKSVKRKEVYEETLDEAGLAPTKVGKFYRSGIKLGGELASRAAAAKHVWKQYKSQKSMQSSDDEAMKRAAGAEPSQSTSAPKKTSVLKPQGGVKGAYNVWMQKEKPKSIGGHALSLISKTLSAAERG